MFHGILIGLGIGLAVGFTLTVLYWQKEIAAGKMLKAAGYTKLEQIAAFIRKWA